MHDFYDFFMSARAPMIPIASIKKKPTQCGLSVKCTHRRIRALTYAHRIQLVNKICIRLTFHDIKNVSVC